MDLVEFLRARLARDEGIARACSGASWATAPSGTVAIEDPAGTGNGQARGDLTFVASVENEAYGEHIARQDPARVLREVAAKRQIIDEYEKQAWMLGQGRRTDQAEGAHAAREAVLRLLALTYAEHPAYRDEWRP